MTFDTNEQKLTIPSFLCLNPTLSYPRKETLLEPGSHNEKTHATEPQSICNSRKAKPVTWYILGVRIKILMYIFMCIEEKVSKVHTKLLTVVIKSMYTIIFTFHFVHFHTVSIFYVHILLL